MVAIDTVRNFDVHSAVVTLWTFRGPAGPARENPRYSGRWTRTTDDVDEALKATFVDEVNRIEEVKNYGLLEENHETSALLIGLDETHVGYVLEKCAAETQNRQASRREHIANSSFYLAKFTVQDAIVYGVRKADQMWKTKRAMNFRTMVFRDGELDIDDRPRFDISCTFDFIVADGEILCLNKRNFESILRYKQAHQNDFSQLQGEPEFIAAFADLAPLVEFVGSNKIQLRRASAIRQKGHYRDASFMENLRQRHSECGLTLEFNRQGQIVATPETCSDVVTALLDHRLTSRFSEMYFDVPSSTAVEV
ncbi:MAG: DUF4868 domain-containing protein [Rhodobacteraceae bacterium]|nr:DUF4868 domain-containing protein [Paracoccaceae bacterium]